MALKLVPELVAAVVIDIEGICLYAQDTGLGTLDRKTGIDEKDGILLRFEVGTEKEGRETSLHRAYGRDTAERGNVNVQKGLQKA